MRVLKGHGTENDFVVVPDLDGALTLTPALIRALCDRHAGIGADGVLRVVRSENDRDAKEMALDAPFFMDYRNADGSVAEMCGNGIRVFMRYLQGAGLVESTAAVATRGGIRRVVAEPDGDFTVDMGHPLVLADRPVVTAAPLSAVPGMAIELPNPHVVVFVDRDQLGALELGRPPFVDPPGPAGQNVEFVVGAGPRRLVMRVHERGVGETRSCGTGLCAAAVAAALADGVGADGVPWQVDVPGGSCTVTWDAETGVRLRGPAVLVAEIELDDAWLGAALDAAQA
jgi:diaminopimelate epimerase